MIICNTIRGKGIKEIEGKVESNYTAMVGEIYKQALEDIKKLSELARVELNAEEKKSLIAVTVCEDVTLMKFWTKDAITIRIVSEKVAQSFLMLYQLLDEHKP